MKNQEEMNLKLKEIITELEEKEINGIEIRFDGSGDEGSIYQVDSEPNPLDRDLEERLENWAYDFLDNTGVDWYNDDGGFGMISINPIQKTYSFEVSQRYYESSVEASGEDINIFGDE